MREVTSDDDDNGSADGYGEAKDFTPRRRKAKKDYRAEITPAAAPKAGFNTTIIEQVLAAGPTGIRKAQQIALRHAKRYHEDAVDYWRKKTDWLKNSDGSYRAHARYALAWRPRFLAALSMCHSVQLACRYVRVSPDTAYYHRSHDRQFAKQWKQARDHAIEMLHARVFQRALEGDCEPIFYMGVRVGYVRKFSDKLQIELLRAYKPDQFKTPGTQVNIGTKGDIFVLSEDQRHELMRVNREFLELTPVPARELPASQVVTQQPEQLTNGEGAL
ncbi:MAG TPA: hypothetical protein VF878_05870 [Candidatus Udaeobacter sp.]